MITDIVTTHDVIEFTRCLIEEGTNVHPDDDFFNYVNMETDLPTYNSDEATLRNQLMEQSFIVCEKAGIDIYDLMQEEFLKATGLDKYIPLPSQL